MAPIPSTATNTWNPYKAFQINPDQLTCAGYAPSKGRECHNQVGQEWRSKARTIMCYIMTLNPTHITAKDLDDLALNLLCVRYHRHNTYGERDELTAKWLRNLQLYLKTSQRQSSVVKHPTEELKSQLVDAQIDRRAKARSLVESQEVSAALTLTLEDTQRRLANKDSRCDELQGLNASLLREKKEKEGICELYLREKWDLTDQLKMKEEQHKEQKAADQAEIERLNDLLKERDIELADEQSANKTLKARLKHFNKTSNEKISKIAALTQQCSEQEQTITGLQTELASKDDALTGMRTDLQSKADSLKRAERTSDDQATEIVGHEESNRKLRAKLFLQAFTLRKKHRELEGARADAEAILDQHKILQRAKTEVDGEYRALEKMTTPLKLRNVRKGFAGVLSIHPMRLRTHRISGEGASGLMNESTLVGVPEG